MKIDELLKHISGKFGSKILKTYKHNSKRVYVDVYPKDVVEITKHLFKDLGMRFNIASGVDDFDSIEVLYHFSDDREGFVLTVRAMIKEKDVPSVDTITSYTRSAWWIEREIHELFGVGFNGNNDLRPLLLPDEWPKGVYPMRKNFTPPKRDSRKS